MKTPEDIVAEIERLVYVEHTPEIKATIFRAHAVVQGADESSESWWRRMAEALWPEGPPKKKP
jgi:hypothetical protein